jgi:hypothetical protein
MIYFTLSKYKNVVLVAKLSGGLGPLIERKSPIMHIDHALSWLNLPQSVDLRVREIEAHHLA